MTREVSYTELASRNHRLEVAKLTNTKRVRCTWAQRQPSVLQQPGVRRNMLQVNLGEASSSPYACITLGALFVCWIPASFLAGRNCRLFSGESLSAADYCFWCPMAPRARQPVPRFRRATKWAFPFRTGGRRVVTAASEYSIEFLAKNREEFFLH